MHKILICCLLSQGSPNYDLLAKSGQRSHFIRPQRHFLIMKKYYIYKNLVDLVECDISRNNHITLRCPTLEPLCNSLCGPLTKRFGDPVLSFQDEKADLLKSCFCIRRSNRWTFRSQWQMKHCTASPWVMKTNVTRKCLRKLQSLVKKQPS